MGVNRLKGLHKKTSDGFATFEPFGTDGLFIDMMDGLNLEEQNIFAGGPSSFSVDSTTGDITEIYRKNNSVSIYYKVITSYAEDSTHHTDTITSELYVMPDNTLVKTKTTVITWDVNDLNITNIASTVTDQV